jgi:hypothetical protein
VDRRYLRTYSRRGETGGSYYPFPRSGRPDPKNRKRPSSALGPGTLSFGVTGGYPGVWVRDRDGPFGPGKPGFKVYRKPGKGVTPGFPP